MRGGDEEVNKGLNKEGGGEEGLEEGKTNVQKEARKEEG